ncbi:MAG TPA: RNA polymerase sigma factor [Candidatus Kapabacteria bacterium]|jgi:RNA polymerase sigma-70 factor (ECF subfamily)
MNEIEEAGSLSIEGGLDLSTIGAQRQREFLALLMPHLPKLTRFCRALYRTSGDGNFSDDKERAKDLLSETILKAWEHFDQVLEPKAFLSYLFTIASRESRYRKKRGARSQPFSAFDRDFTELQGDDPSPDAAADIYYLYVALEKLPAHQREAIVMSEIAGMKLEEVAEAQRASLSAVKSRVSRGRKKLAKLLGVKEARSIDGHASAIPAKGPEANSYYRFAYQGKDKL